MGSSTLEAHSRSGPTWCSDLAHPPPAALPGPLEAPPPRPVPRPRLPARCPAPPARPARSREARGRAPTAALSGLRPPAAAATACYSRVGPGPRFANGGFTGSASSGLGCRTRLALLQKQLLVQAVWRPGPPARGRLRGRRGRGRSCSRLGAPGLRGPGLEAPGGTFPGAGPGLFLWPASSLRPPCGRRKIKKLTM